MLHQIYFTEKQKLRIIKELLRIDSKDKRKKLMTYYRIKGMSSNDSFKLNVQYEYINKIKKNTLRNIELYNNEIIMYHEILNSTVKLAKELKLSNAMEYSNLFTYLLWNGYLSKNKELYFDAKKTKCKHGILFLDIINGCTTCLNNSVFLKDFLTKAGYESIVLENKYQNINKKYIPNIKRKEKRYPIYNLIDSLISKTVNRYTENHAFTLVKEQNSLYIYDSTTLTVFKIKSNTLAEIITGDGKCALGPISSFGYINNKKDEQLLDSFMLYKGDCPYDYEQIIETWDNNNKLFDSSNLISDYYSDNYKRLNKIMKIKRF